MTGFINVPHIIECWPMHDVTFWSFLRRVLDDIPVNEVIVTGYDFTRFVGHLLNERYMAMCGSVMLDESSYNTMYNFVIERKLWILVTMEGMYKFK